jgi:hypothetical protein
MLASRGSVSSKEKVNVKGSEKVSEKHKDKCLLCATAVKEEENGIQCELCEMWVHAKCEKINEEGFKVLSMDNIHWYCLGCNKGVGRVLSTVMKMQRSHDKMDSEIKEIQGNFKQHQEQVESELDGIKGGMEEIKNEMKVAKEAINELYAAIEQQREDQKKIETNEGLWSTIVGKHVEKQVDMKMDNMTGQLEEVHKTLTETSTQAKEERDKEERRNNIILYRVPESNKATYEDRKKEDQEFVTALIQQGLSIPEARVEDLRKAIRLGKKEAGKDRPLLIELPDRGTKNYMMERLQHLKNAEERFNKVVFAHDMTILERDECKKLVEEAKIKESEDHSGEWVYRVRGPPGQMKILKLRKR